MEKVSPEDGVATARAEAPAAPGLAASSGRSATLVVCALVAVALCGYTLRALWPAIIFRADLLMWSESDLVGNVIKLERGSPLYTPAAESNSLIYTPGASLLTWALLHLAGQPMSVPGLRIVQLVLATLAAALAAHNVGRLARLIGPDPPPAPLWAWRTLSFALLWLAATAPAVNAHVLALHTDAASLLLSMAGFWVTLRYLERPDGARLLVLALYPGLAFLFKQLLASWLAVLTLLLLLREPRNFRRWGGFALLGGLGVAAAIALGMTLWGDSFRFWTLELPGARRFGFGLDGVRGGSLLRAVDHLLRAWSELALGLVGGVLALRGASFRRLAPLWLAWLALVGFEALSSAGGWHVLYHFGPGALIGLCWLLAALPSWWRGGDAPSGVSDRLRIAWRRSLFALGMLGVALALRVVPSRDPGAARYFPPRGVPTDLERYVRDIESETVGYPLDRVLLDWGNWLYLPGRVLIRDRAGSLADQPYSGIYENFDGLLERLSSHYYALVLVRNLHQPNFLYDWHDWERSSGVRAALLRDYEEVRIIPGVVQRGLPVAQSELTGPVSVLVPRRRESL